MKLHLACITLICATLLGAQALAASAHQEHPRQLKWEFDGVFGTFDEQAIQRGLQVYKQVCASCHGLTRVAFRELTKVGFSENEVAKLASDYTFTDGPNDDGDMFERPGRASDKFPAPYANENAARSINNGAYPPDLSLMVKARPDGANYVYSLLTGYKDAGDTPVGDGQYYNPYFPGGLLSMAPPLMDDMVEYQDGTKASMDQMARDVVSFLQWAAEPEMQERKRMGIKVMLFLFVFTILFYIAKKRVWADLH